MIRKVSFESQERRIKQVLAALNANGIKDIEEANQICENVGIDPYQICEDTQGICFENAKWAYVCGAAIAIKKGVKTAADAAEAIGIGLQSFCIPGSVADDRKVGIGHGNLAARLLREETECFAFLAGHESFAAAEGAIKIAEMANKVRKNPLRTILNGLGKDAAMIISRINGFTYVQTKFDYYTGELKVVQEIPYSDGPRAKVKCYGADDVREGVAILWKENVDVSITGNSTNPTRFQHPVAGTYKKERVLAGKPYFSVASGGGTGRTLHPDNMAAGPASYGMTDTLGRMHSDAQFAGLMPSAWPWVGDGRHGPEQEISIPTCHPAARKAQPQVHNKKVLACGMHRSEDFSFHPGRQAGTGQCIALTHHHRPTAMQTASARNGLRPAAGVIRNRLLPSS